MALCWFARNLDDLRLLVQALTRKGERVEFVKESLVFTGEDSPMANLMLSVMGAFAEFERSLSGNAKRKASPWPSGAAPYKGRKKTLTPERAAELVQRAGSGVPKSLLARNLTLLTRPKGTAPLRIPVPFAHRSISIRHMCQRTHRRNCPTEWFWLRSGSTREYIPPIQALGC